MGLGRSFASVCCTPIETIHGRVEYLGLKETSSKS